MPHQCTNCGHRFEDGSKAMLSGCPSCDGNKFQFIPAGRDAAPADSTGNEGATSQSHAASQGASESAAHESTGATASGSNPTGANVEAEGAAATDAGETTSGVATEDDPEDDAQTNARSSFVSSNELAEARRKMADAEEQRLAEVDGEVSERVDQSAAAHDEVDADDEDDNANLQALRQELNDQFESIKIKAPGQYELNLMELYDREEYIISLREDGKYVIEMPETWRDDD